MNIAWELAGVSISIILGTGVGVLAGIILYRIFDRFNPRATKRTLIVMAVSVVLLRIEHLTSDFLPFAALLAVMAIGLIIIILGLCARSAGT